VFKESAANILGRDRRGMIVIVPITSLAAMVEISTSAQTTVARRGYEYSEWEIGMFSRYLM
jgi:hypothetical protein